MAAPFDATNGLGSDACAIEARDLQNQGITTYMTSYLRPDATCDARESASARAIETRSRTQWMGYGMDSCRVDEDSALRQAPGGLTNLRGRQQLSARTFLAVPDLSRGQQRGVADDEGPGLQGALRTGMDTTLLNACSRVTEKDFRRFAPNVCPVGVEHIVPTFWVHGGASSRDIARSTEFLAATRCKAPPPKRSQ